MPKDIDVKSDVSIKPMQQVKVEGIVIGQISQIVNGSIYVISPVTPNGLPLKAVSLVPAATLEAGQSVGLMFVEGNVTQPTIIGKMHVETSNKSELIVKTDHESISLQHDREINFKCGKAKLTLTADGRVDISGEYVISTARTTNRIAGASVKIN